MSDHERARRRLPQRLRRRRYHEAEILRRRLKARRPSTGAHTPANGETNSDSSALVERARDQMLRLQAEFENYRKRSKKELEDFRETANSNLVKEFLPVLDNISRALQNPGVSLESFVEGIKMVNNLFTQTLKSAGLEPIQAVGQPFDPNFHEAVLVDNSGEHPENQVVEVLQEGFMLKGKLIRPALVKVARKG
jgi:molecular chaperone GrpE